MHLLEQCYSDWFLVFLQFTKTHSMNATFSAISRSWIRVETEGFLDDLNQLYSSTLILCIIYRHLQMVCLYAKNCKGSSRFNIHNVIQKMSGFQYSIKEQYLLLGQSEWYETYHIMVKISADDKYFDQAISTNLFKHANMTLHVTEERAYSQRLYPRCIIYQL